jgi:hypothetical protein
MQIDDAKLRDFAQRYTAAWCGGDPAAVAEFFSPSGSLKVNEAGPAVGRHAITEVARLFMSAFPDLRVVMDDLRTVNGRVQYHWTLTGTYENQNAVCVSGFEEWQLGEDGLIAVSDGHFDAADYERQLTNRNG